MIEIYLFAGVTLVAAGIALGVIAIVSLGIHREERAFSLTTASHGRVTGGARVACGVFTRGLDPAQPAHRPH
jgi:hypothetical protein